jgi:S-adenosylmethionine hydrolase
MIALFTDFGLHGPCTGQMMKAVLHQMAPGTPVIDLFADAPVGNPKTIPVSAGHCRLRYENSNGLAEIAINQGRADRDLGLAIGIRVEIVS